MEWENDEDGVAMVSMHWEGYADSKNANMTEAYARKQGYGEMIEYYDAQQEATPQVEQTSKEVATSGPKVNLVQLLGNEVGGYLERKSLPFPRALSLVILRPVVGVQCLLSVPWNRF